MAASFLLLDPDKKEPAARKSLLAARQLPKTLGNLKATAALFQPSRELVGAVNACLSIGAPLLLTGEPGTGKTQVAHYLAWYFGITDALYQLDVRSNTTAEDLLYHFDAVAYFHAAHDPSRAGQQLDRGKYIERGPLWKAMETVGPSLVLIDEIDKAPRDFPNDLLAVLDEGHFFVREQGESGTRISRRSDAAPPIVIITSNSERRLPEAFLRRCVFHHIAFTDDLVMRAVAARRGQLGGLSDEAVNTAVGRFLELRQKNLRKRPATAELLAWLMVLSAQGDIDANKLSIDALSELPHLSVLIKDRDDLQSL